MPQIAIATLHLLDDRGSLTNPPSMTLRVETTDDSERLIRQDIRVGTDDVDTLLAALPLNELTHAALTHRVDAAFGEHDRLRAERVDTLLTAVTAMREGA